MIHVAVRGRVQGVGFRWFGRERARELKLVGWVRNLPDGSVEVLAHGEEESLARLRSSLLAGPTGADVSSLDELAENPSAPVMQPFGILR